MDKEYQKHRIFKLYKPSGYISQFVYEKKRKKKKLGELFDFPEGTMAIGRLDENSEGLLLLTTDGMVSEWVRSASFEKEYFVLLDGVVTEGALQKLRAGLTINVKGMYHQTKPCVAEKIQAPTWVGEGRRVRDDRHGPTSWIRMILTEGKFRQIRKMTAQVGFPTLRLIRIRIGNWTLEGMREGEVQELENNFYEK